MQKIEISHKTRERLGRILSKFNSYSEFSKSKADAYKYANTIGVRSCPYCNINYTYSVSISGRSKCEFVCRPDFDHFVAKSIDGSLLKDIDNLIPSCLVCNRTIKGKKYFKATTHVHPFKESFDEIKRFSIDLNSADYLSEDSIEIVLKDRPGAEQAASNRADNNIKDLHLLERYKQHRTDVLDLLKKASYYHRQRRKEICDILQISEMKVHLFPHIESEEINQSSLSKLKRDVCDLVLSED